MDSRIIDKVAALRHYSGLNNFKTLVLGAFEDIVIVKLTKDFAVLNFFEGDPVVLGYEQDGQVYILGCTIHKIRPKDNSVELKIDKVDSSADQRQYERYPVSLYGDIRARYGSKKYLVTIKDISYYGMLVYSKTELQINDLVEVDIYMDKNIVFLKGNIVRKMQTPHHFEYGLTIVYDDKNSINLMKEYIKRLRKEQEDAVVSLHQEVNSQDFNG